ncbi:MAG: SUF system NifU family Fe-S cluster assembly protein [Acidobacteria bacterium]|nr:SUF system NifU family Fe-S cluster assembly protein [Acidobacteriota bacterium]
MRELYGEVILDHNRRPRNFGRLHAASHSAAGHNPLCGDRVTVDLRVEDGRIADIAFEGVGCAISTASASMMTEALRGKSLAEARQLFERFHALVTGGPPAAGAGTRAGTAARTAAELEDQAASPAGGGGPELGKLAAFAGVGEYPMRVKCATLAWHALQSALAAPAGGSAPGKAS